MKAFIISLAALAVITVAAAFGLGAVNLSSQAVYSTNSVRL